MGRIESASATSTDISNINEEVIDSLRTRHVLRSIKRTVGESTKYIYTADEIFDINDKENIFRVTAKNIIEILLKAGQVKNRIQLEYLASSRHTLNEKLRFTLKPHFGFLFKVESPEYHVYIWELLETHATYVWESRSGDRSGFIDIITEAISFIRQNGRKLMK